MKTGLILHKWKYYLFAVIVVVSALLVIPFLIPMESYIGRAEEMAAEKLGVPVSIQKLHVAMLPSPRLNIGGLVVGGNNEIKVEDVAVVPAISSLLSDTRAIAGIQITKPVIKKAALDILAALSSRESDEDARSSVAVHRIIVRNAVLEWPGMRLPEMNADIILAPGNKPQSASLESVDGKLRLDLAAEKGQRLITVNAEEWTVPVGPPLLFDRLHSEMTLHDNRLEISRVDAALYRGRIDGQAELNWGKGWNLAGKLNIEGVSVREPASLMTRSARISGSLLGSGHFSAKAKEAALLADQLKAQFRFDVKNGVLYGFDLAKAPLMLLGKGQGGETRFDVFSGLLEVSGKHYHLRDLKASSGLFAADGAVRINARKELDGVVKVEVKSSATLAEIPLQVSGTVDHPVVLPTKAAMAGAVAGTAVLGPGAGTGLGLKAGAALDKVKGLLGGNQ